MKQVSEEETDPDVPRYDSKPANPDQPTYPASNPNDPNYVDPYPAFSYTEEKLDEKGELITPDIPESQSYRNVYKHLIPDALRSGAEEDKKESESENESEKEGEKKSD